MSSTRLDTDISVNKHWNHFHILEKPRKQKYTHVSRSQAKCHRGVENLFPHMKIHSRDALIMIMERGKPDSNHDNRAHVATILCTFTKRCGKFGPFWASWQLLWNVWVRFTHVTEITIDSGPDSPPPKRMSDFFRKPCLVAVRDLPHTFHKFVENLAHVWPRGIHEKQCPDTGTLLLCSDWNASVV